MDFLDNHHIVNAWVPQIDAGNGNETTDWIGMRDYSKLTFIVHTGDATAGTADGAITVNAATTAAGGGTTAITFHYRTCASSTTVDTWGARTAATATGFVMTAGDNYIYAIEVDAEEVSSQLAGADFVSLTLTEDTNDPIVSGCLAILSGARYPQSIPATAIA
tara:strand:+ start:3329 stop:3817 length:489 start_codon:yes stop_codon:yes gene_type:complete